MVVFINSSDSQKKPIGIVIPAEAMASHVTKDASRHRLNPTTILVYASKSYLYSQALSILSLTHLLTFLLNSF